MTEAIQSDTEYAAALSGPVLLDGMSFHPKARRLWNTDNSALLRQGMHVLADDAQHDFVGTTADGGQATVAVQA